MDEFTKLVLAINLQGYPTAGQGQGQGLDALVTESPQNLLSKRTKSIWCLLGNKFVVDKFSELVSAEIATFLRERLLRDQTAGHGLK